MAYNLSIGIVIKLEEKGAKAIEWVNELGFKVCQISVYDTSYYTDDMANALREDCEKYGVHIDGVWTGWPGELFWNFTKGPETVGLVPPHLRDERARVIKEGSDFARKLGVDRIITHLGFVPEDMKDPKYTELIPILQDIAVYCRANGQDFLFETGQETPVTLLRTIEDVDMENVGINLDPANLVLYGKGNPVDSLDVFGRYVKGVHIKDGTYPRDGRNLGEEKPVGKGVVDFPALLAKLQQLGYRAPLCIECELSEDIRLQEIENAKQALEGLLAAL